MLCPICNKEKDDSIDKEAIEKLGMCLNCDHLLADEPLYPEDNEDFYEGGIYGN